MTSKLKHLLNKVNRVTAYHRHGNDIPMKALDDLANAQLEFEDMNNKIDVHAQLDQLSCRIEDIRNGKIKTSKITIEENDGLTIVRFEEK